MTEPERVRDLSRLALYSSNIHSFQGVNLKRKSSCMHFQKAYPESYVFVESTNFWVSPECWLMLDTARARRDAKTSKEKINFHYLLECQNGNDYGPRSIKSNPVRIHVPITNFVFLLLGQADCVHDFGAMFSRPVLLFGVKALKGDRFSSLVLPAYPPKNNTFRPKRFMPFSKQSS